MNDRAPAPGGLALIQELVNTLNLETGADSLATEEGRGRSGSRRVTRRCAGAQELRESLRVACLAHAGYPPHGPCPGVDRASRGGARTGTGGRRVRRGVARLRADPLASLTARVAVAVAEG